MKSFLSEIEAQERDVVAVVAPREGAKEALKPEEGTTTLVKRHKGAKRPLEPWMMPVVVRLVKDMMPLKSVAGYVGVDAKTFRGWLAQGEDPDCKDDLLREFAYAVRRAQAEMTEDGVRMLKAHAPNDHRALMELLRAADPETWGQKSHVKVDTEVRHTMAVDLSKLTDEQIDEYERLHRLATGE